MTKVSEQGNTKGVTQNSRLVKWHQRYPASTEIGTEAGYRTTDAEGILTSK